ncbi:MAG: hypothetical protein WC538_10590 [Thermoanaerobaculia bacterium]|jgi:hypothetical protein
MIFALALSTALASHCTAPVTSETETEILQLLLERVVETDAPLGDGPVLVACATTELVPTGGAPLEHNELWADQVDRNRTVSELRVTLPKRWVMVDVPSLVTEKGADWHRIQDAYPSTEAVVRFARPGFSADGLHAVAQTEVLLPGGERAWHVYWFDRTDEGWSKVDRRTARAPFGFSFPYDPRWELSQGMRADRGR